MDKQVAKLMEGLRKDPMYELYNDTQLAAFAEEIKQDLMDYEASVRPSGMHWPENLVAAILGLKWVELKKSADGESVEEVLSGLLDTLTPRESKVIELFYKEEKGLFEIADEFNVSGMKIRITLAKGTRKLLQPARAKRLAALVEKSDKEPVIRTRERSLREWLDDGSEGNNAEDDAPDGDDDGDAPEGDDDDFIKHLFDDPDDTGDK